jgi:hypothetical protein
MEENERKKKRNVYFAAFNPLPTSSALSFNTSV